MKYTDALPPDQHQAAHTFIHLLCSTYGKAKSQGLIKPDIESFFKTYRDNFETSKNRTYYQRYSHDRRTKGLCVFCKSPAVPGLSVCEVHREKKKAYAQASRRRRELEKVSCQ